ncbi:ABC transporter substrate-binding protein [Sorangium sp. So ce117]|uniref:ABC transporter substrate-binding protein n=1 Tax=Sorangium sp. So ce117 TaxID=3133277 RepID=UPI003F621292
MSRCLSAPPATGVRQRAVEFLGLLLVFALALSGCGRGDEANAGAWLALDAAIPADFPRETKLRIGDPTVQKQLQLSGEIGALPFAAGWQNISGGPLTVEAFRAGALDGGSVGDTPPIHATFTGLDVKIIAVQVREKPLSKLALTSRQVDVAPLSGTILLRYLNEYRDEGATSIEHGVRENLSFFYVFYVRTAALEDANKAAALREYVKRRTRAQLWAYANPDVWIDAYYVKDQGLTAAEGRCLVESAGKPQYPGDWTEAIALTQETADMVAEATGQTRFDARTI